MKQPQSCVAGLDWAVKPLLTGHLLTTRCACMIAARTVDAGPAGPHLHHQCAVVLHRQIHSGGPADVHSSKVCPVVQQAGGDLGGICQGSPVERRAAVCGVARCHARAPAEGSAGGGKQRVSGRAGVRGCCSAGLSLGWAGRCPDLSGCEQGSQPSAVRTKHKLGADGAEPKSRRS